VRVCVRVNVWVGVCGWVGVRENVCVRVRVLGLCACVRLCVGLGMHRCVEKSAGTIAHPVNISFMYTYTRAHIRYVCIYMYLHTNIYPCIQYIEWYMYVHRNTVHICIYVQLCTYLHHARYINTTNGFALMSLNRCIYMHIYVYMYSHLYIHVYIYTYIHICTYLYTYLCIFIYMCVSILIHVNLKNVMDTRYVHWCTCMYICISPQGDSGPSESGFPWSAAGMCWKCTRQAMWPQAPVPSHSRCMQAQSPAATVCTHDCGRSYMLDQSTRWFLDILGNSTRVTAIMRTVDAM